VELLNCRFRSAQAFAVEPRAVEAANASLPGREHGAGIFDPASARFGLLGGGDPVDPISARIGRDVRPHCACLLCGGGNSFLQIGRHLGFGFLSRRRDLERDDVAYVCARSFGQLSVHFEPVAFLAVGFERGLKRKTIDGAFNRRYAPRGKFRTGVFWQDKKGPGIALLAFRRPEEFRFETDSRFWSFGWSH